MLDGENKYYCERCDRKVRAEKLVTIKKMPKYLIIALKRF
jgi:ubiquitin C-terminal hydrolase